MEVNHGGFDITMSEKFLDGSDIKPIEKKMCGIRVTKRMRSYPFDKTAFIDSSPKLFTENLMVKVILFLP